MPSAPDPAIDEDSDYASSEDSDFAPDVAPAAAVSDSSSDSDSELETEGPATKSKKRKRKGKDVQEAEDLGFENSGDEAIVKEHSKKQRRSKKGKNAVEAEEEDTGEGLFVRTRRMAALAIEEEKRPLANTADATVDVDALWESMMSGPPQPSAIQPADPSSPESRKAASKPQAPPEQEVENQMITIKRTYNFAGKVHTEQKLVPRDSAEARLYLLSQPGIHAPSADSAASSALEGSKPLRPRPKARRSIFEPVTDYTANPQTRRSDLYFGEAAIARLNLDRGAEKARKLNTVEKSKMDWAGFVDKEGIREELEGADKAKKGMLGQAEFLARVEGNREEEARRARLKTLNG